MPDDVQPTEGQGSEAGGLFDSYLQAVPDEARETVTSYLKDAEKNVNSRLQEAAEIKKTWEPFQNVQEALSPYAQNPQVLSERLAWLDQVTADENALDEWVRAYAQERGLTLGEAEKEIAQEEEAGELTREQVQQLADERAQENLAPIQQQLQELVEIRQTDAIEQEIKSFFAQAEKDTGKTYSDDQRVAIMNFTIHDEADEQWLAHGLEQYQKMEAMVQKNFVDDKSKQPEPAITTGSQQAFKATTDWGEANEQMRERFRAMRQ